MPRVRIGTYVLAEPTTFTRTYETASWYTLIEVPAGEYEVTAVVRDGKVSSTWGEGPMVRLDGVVTRSHFVNRVFQYSSVEDDRDVGKPMSYTLTPYTYSVAHQILNGEGGYRLDPGFEAREIHFESVIDGKPCVTHGLFVKEA